MSAQGPLEAEHAEIMKDIGRTIGAVLNGDTLDGLPRPLPRMGFALLVFPFEGHEGRMNYVSNASRDDMVVALKELVAQMEGRVPQEGRA